LLQPKIAQKPVWTLALLGKNEAGASSIKFYVSRDQFKENPAVYLKSPVWDFAGGSWAWNWTEL